VARAGKNLPIAALDWPAIVRPGDLVVWPQAGAEPIALTRSLMAARYQIGGFRAGIGLSLSETPDPDHMDRVTFLSYCGGGTNIRLARAGGLDMLPVPFSFLSAALDPTDVLLLQVPPSDAAGSFAPGLALEYIAPLIASARTVIAQVNEQLPRVASDVTLRASDFDIIVTASEPPLSMSAVCAGATEMAIAQHISAIVEDGATLQSGLGKLPETILSALVDRRDLGAHSGAIGDWVMCLTRSGALTNARKPHDIGVSVGGLILGSRALYDFAHDNPALRLAPTSYTHNAERLAALPRFTAINSAIEVDLTGQINAEMVDGTYVGAVGGAAEFLRGAHRSRGGLPIVALPAEARKSGKSRIVARLSGPVSTPRSEAGLIVTEHGIADLRGKSLNQRRDLMLAIAAPQHRATLDSEAQG
jgi:acyl-CoA hydrolase